MNVYAVKDDRMKLCLYTILNLILTLCFILIIIFTLGNAYYLLSFLGITALWFSVKYMCRYGIRLIKDTSICEFHKTYISFPVNSNDLQSLSYKEIKEVKILRDWKSIKLFFSGNKVQHPSDWYYIGIIYLFRNSYLYKIEDNIINILKKNNITYEVVKKGGL